MLLLQSIRPKLSVCLNQANGLMDSASWTGETGTYDPEQDAPVFAEKSQTSPETPVKFAFSLPCCVFYFLITLGVLISLFYVPRNFSSVFHMHLWFEALLCTFWFVVMVRDSRVDDVRKGKNPLMLTICFLNPCGQNELAFVEK